MSEAVVKSPWDVGNALREHQQQEDLIRLNSVSTDPNIQLVTYIIRSQRSPRDVYLALELKHSLEGHGVATDKIHMLHERELQIGEDDNARGYWTVLIVL
jgi:hypothetical protein